MKKLLFAAASVLALSAPAFAADMPVKAAPAPQAMAPCSGYIGGWGEWGRISEASGEREKSSGWGADARLNCWINPAWSWQLDGEVDQLLHHGDVAANGNSPASRHEALVVAHFDWRDPQVGTAGIFGGWVRPNDIDDGRYVNMGMIGVEGQRYFGMLTLYAQAGYLGFNKIRAGITPDQATNNVFGRLVARYFFTPNDKLSGEIGYDRGEMIDQPGDKMRIWNWAATYEHKFDASPISAFVQYSGANLKSTFNPSTDRIREHTVLAGLRWYFNQGTLFTNDRTGATHDTPGFIRYLPHVGIAD